MVGLTNVDNISDANKPVSSAQQSALNLKANLASPTFTGTIGGISKAMVGLGNVDNIADSAKVVGSATTAGSAADNKQLFFMYVLHHQFILLILIMHLNHVGYIIIVVLSGFECY
jgi:hypothetical protein